MPRQPQGRKTCEVDSVPELVKRTISTPKRLQISAATIVSISFGAQ
jgi:hypothetical protein